MKRTTIRSKARWLMHWLVLAAGSALVLRMAYWAQGGKALLWAFEPMDEHRFTAMAILTGTLRLRNGVAALTNDEQAYNGATYTNWGFGVPLLQAPLHALAAHTRWFSSSFFPDRAIFFGYVALLVPLLWLALSRVLTTRSYGRHGFREKTWTFAATSLLLTSALFPLMASRFWIYEETIAYFIVAELFALTAYVYATSSKRFLPIALLGAAAGMGLLIRATGLGYFAIWGLLVVLERRSRRAALSFVGGSMPFFVFWLVSNRVKSGSPFSFGYANSNPWHAYHIPIVRFGSLCSDTLGHAGVVARAMLRAFFVGMNLATEPYLEKCHFDFEVRPGGVGATESAFGVGVLAVLAWILLHHIARRERHVAIYLPFVALAVLFAEYVIAGGFAWRYEGDFWPLIALIVVQYIRGLSPARYRGAFGFRAALVLGGLAYAEFHRNVTPVVEKIETLDAASAARLGDRFADERWELDQNLPTRLECGEDVTTRYYRGREGWGPACTVDTFSNVFLGVPDKSERRYELRLETRGIVKPSVRVYVNGRYYTAARDGETYRTEVDIDYAALRASAVQVTVEWERGFEAPAGKLAAVELI